MMAISSDGLLRLDESNKNPGILSFDPVRKIGQDGKIQLREGDILRFGRACDEPWMCFEVRRVPNTVTPIKAEDDKCKDTPCPGTGAAKLGSNAPKGLELTLHKPRKPLYCTTKKRRRKIAFDSSSDEAASLNSWLQRKKRKMVNSSLSSDSDDSFIRRTRRRKQQQRQTGDQRTSTTVSKPSQNGSSESSSMHGKLQARKSLFRRRHELMTNRKAATSGSSTSENERSQDNEARLRTQSEICRSLSSVLSMPECPTLPSSSEERRSEEAECSQIVPEIEKGGGFHVLEETNVIKTSNLATEDWKRLKTTGDSLRQSLASIIVQQRARRGDTTWLPSIVSNAKVRGDAEES